MKDAVIFQNMNTKSQYGSTFMFALLPHVHVQLEFSTTPHEKVLKLINIANFWHDPSEAFGVKKMKNIDSF